MVFNKFDLLQDNLFENVLKLRKSLICRRNLPMCVFCAVNKGASTFIFFSLQFLSWMQLARFINPKIFFKNFKDNELIKLISFRAVFRIFASFSEKYNGLKEPFFIKNKNM